jgi:O-methyltransferase
MKTANRGTSLISNFAMSWRKNANSYLRRLTGYEIRKYRPPAARPRVPAKPSVPSEPKPEINFPLDYDDSVKSIIRAVKPRTMTSPEKLNALIHAVRYVVRHQIPGDIVECGVWRGGSMMAVAKTLIEMGDTDRHLHLYDTFEGMSEPTEHDRRQDGRSATDMLSAADRSSPIWAYASLEDVQQAMRESEYPADRIHYYKGKVEDTIPGTIPDQISILRLDTDWYESTKHELKHLWPRLVPGGVLLIDDYGWWEGARRAVDEWQEETRAQVLLLRMDEGRVAVKPPPTRDNDM